MTHFRNEAPPYFQEKNPIADKISFFENQKTATKKLHKIWLPRFINFNPMAPIKLGNISVEIAVKSIDGFIHELIDVPVRSGFWISFTISNERGKTETFPLVDKHHKLKIYTNYADALHAAAQKIMKSKASDNPGC